MVAITDIMTHLRMFFSAVTVSDDEHSTYGSLRGEDSPPEASCGTPPQMGSRLAFPLFLSQPLRSGHLHIACPRFLDSQRDATAAEESSAHGRARQYLASASSVHNPQGTFHRHVADVDPLGEIAAQRVALG